MNTINTINTSSFVSPVAANGHIIEPVIDNTFFKCAINTKREGTVKFTTYKDARRWARLNKV